MTTEYMCEIEEQAKGVVATVRVISDELNAAEVVEASKKMFDEANKYAINRTMNKLR